MRGLMHHIDLTVSDLVASRAFYDRVLGFLGYGRKADTPHGTDWDWLGGADAGAPFHSIGIVRYGGPDAGRPHDRYTPGLHHLAWAAADPADVDAMHAMLVGMGAEVLDVPAYYPQSGPDYYALFFADPDGMKLEFVAGRTMG